MNLLLSLDCGTFQPPSNIYEIGIILDYFEDFAAMCQIWSHNTLFCLKIIHLFHFILFVGFSPTFDSAQQTLIEKLLNQALC